MTQYLFGYGSLINAASRDRTGHTGAAWPARVVGFQRGWNVVGSKIGCAAVGITPQTQASCNGVLVQVPPQELPNFDRRERQYERLELASSQVTLLSAERMPPGTVWTYVIAPPGRPSADCPIVQSYVDVILTGCLDIAPEFAVEFITTTTGWDSPWLDDRSAPRYPRALQDLPNARDIDALLQKYAAPAFLRRSAV